jgi:phosphoglycolate phosphatase
LFENEVYPGIPEMLVAMQASGHRLFVATSKPTVYSTQIIDHFQLSGYFERVYGSELDGRLTDKGELIGHILTSERLDARDTVMVGDRMHDMVGARANSVIGIGVLYGYGDRDELDSAGAVALVESPADLPSAIKALHRG